MTLSDQVLRIFEKSGALLRGHFVLRSGHHSREFFQCALALQMMPDVEFMGQELSLLCKDLKVDTIVAPAMGGLVIGQEVARQFKKRFIFLEKVDGSLVLRRGFKIEQGESVLVVEDVVTRGGRAFETINLVQSYGGKVVGVAMIVDRSNGSVNFGVPTHSLIRLQVETFDPKELPSDLKYVPAVKPGS